MKILENKDIRLVPLAQDHEYDYVRLANIPEINQRLSKPFPYSDNHFARQLENVRGKEFYIWMIQRSGEIIGVINSGAGRSPQLFQGGYWVEPPHWGKGVASASLMLVRDFLLDECNVQRVQAVVEPDNIASIRVLEKCGYEREGLLRKYYPSSNRGLVDVLMYAVVR